MAQRGKLQTAAWVLDIALFDIGNPLRKNSFDGLEPFMRSGSGSEHATTLSRTKSGYASVVEMGRRQ